MGQLVINMEELGKPAKDSLMSNNLSYSTQVYAALSASLGALAIGNIMGYSSPTGPHLLSNSTGESLQLSQTEYNWFSSSVNLGAAAGGLVGGLCINTLGRRGTMLASVLPYLAGWVLVGCAQNFAMILLGRLITGMCMGVTCVAVPTFIAEFSSANIRGTLGSGFQLMITVGVLYVYGLAPAVGNFRWLAVSCSFPIVLHMIMVYFTHESPSYLISKGRHEQAATALQYYRGKHYNIEKELRQLQSYLEETQERKRSLADIMRPYNLRPFMICLMLLLSSQLCGVTPVIFNMGIIFKDAGVGLSEEVSEVVVSVVQVAVTGGASLLMDRAGRRIMLLLSAAIMAVSIVSLGVYFYLKEQDSVWAAETLDWLPLTSLILFITAFSLGFGPVPWLMFAAFCITLVFVPLQTAMGDYGVYWLFGGVCLLALVFTFLLVPETNGKTLQEITAHFGGPTTMSPCNMTHEACVAGPVHNTSSGVDNKAYTDSV
ncbi:Facilitated trehalose transporter Tret1-2-like 5 [Homarus americanus]|uniref:Facilitated trehalose transporter Tret1-2-like 5 n=1 Tax=Homarus americanus TaxID=6706 RepID=A0A8J5N0R3_HOMAM|nr:Facilitated trehalose transporter Tret1-2-like 5 [Homarus americanus]